MQSIDDVVRVMNISVPPGFNGLNTWHRWPTDKANAVHLKGGKVVYDHVEGLYDLSGPVQIGNTQYYFRPPGSNFVMVLGRRNDYHAQYHGVEWEKDEPLGSGAYARFNAIWAVYEQTRSERQKSYQNGNGK